MANQKSSVSAPRKRSPRTKTVKPNHNPPEAAQATTPASAVSADEGSTVNEYDDPILERPLWKEWHQYADSHLNSAIAEQAAIEDDSSRPDDICTIITELSYSPMYRILVACLKRDIPDSKSSESWDWEITTFAARICMAGLIAGRRGVAVGCKDGCKDGL